MDPSWASLIAQLVKNPPATQETLVQFLGQEVPLEKGYATRSSILGFNIWVGKIPWRRTWQTTPGFLPGESHGLRSLVGYSPWGHKESHTTERLSTAQVILII